MFSKISVNVQSNYQFNFGTNETPSLPYRIITFPYHLIVAPINCIGNTLQSLFGSRSQLSQEILNLANSMNQDYTWSEREKESVLKALNSMDYLHMKKDLARIFKNASQPVVVEIIQQGIQKGLDEAKEHLNLRPFDLIDFERLMELCQTTSEELTKEISIHAELVKESLHNPLADIVTAKYRKLIPTVIHYIHRLIETLINAFGLESLDLALEYKAPLNYLFDILKQIVLMPIVLCGMLTSSIGFWPAVGATVAITLFLMLITTIYIEFLRPNPEKIANGENMTLTAKKGEYEPVVAREKEMEEIINALGSHERVMIVGKTGVGKTELVKGLALRMTSKDVPQFLEGRTLFHLNTAEFADQGGIEKLRAIQTSLQGFEKRVILFFDEIHVACKPENKNLGDFLKTFSQRYMTIGATTDQEYLHVTTDGAFSGRFCKVDIKPTHDEQTAMIVFEYFRRLLPKVEISLAQVQLIVDLTNQQTHGRNQPDRAKNAVYGIVARLQNNLSIKLNEKKAQLLREVGLLKKQFSLGSHTIIDRTIMENLGILKGKLKKIDDRIAVQMKKIEKINYLQTLRSQVKLDNHQMSVHMLEGRVKPHHLKEMKAKWLIENRFLLQGVTEMINKKADEIPDTALLITESLIREVIDAMA
ncbi:MAG: AAA family ATPase [Chlamydiales bacterium]